MNEEQQTPLIEQVPETKKDWKHQFTTVTPLSKALAMLLFIALPFIGFWVGVNFVGDTGGGDTVPDVAKMSPVTQSPQGELPMDLSTEVNKDNDSYLDIEVSYYPREEVGPSDEKSDVLSWGTWAGIVKDVFTENGVTYIAVDRIGLYKNGGSCRLFIGGFCAVNEKEDIERLEVADDAYITMHWGCVEYENEPTYSFPRIGQDGLEVETGCSLPFDVARQSINKQADYYWLDFDEAGKVVDLVEQYVP